MVTGSAGGMKHDPQWIHNLKAAGHAEVEFGRDRGPSTAKSRAAPSATGCGKTWCSLRPHSSRSTSRSPAA